MGIRSPVQPLFQGAFITFLAAITDIRRLGKFRANILFIENTGRGTFAAGPARPVIAGDAFRTHFLGRAFTLKSQEAVIEGFPIGATFFKRDVVFHFFGDGRAVLIEKPADGFEALAFIQFRFDRNSGIKS